DGRAVRPVELVAPPPARQDPARTTHRGSQGAIACSPGDARANARGRASAYTRGRPGAARTAGNTMAWHHARPAQVAAAHVRRVPDPAGLSSAVAIRSGTARPDRPRPTQRPEAGVLPL